ncbi:hypothetical protein G4B88_014481 [Cannabis sativa]|nr:hypothetical protein G4B88_014481 [Cannabis sativa]
MEGDETFLGNPLFVSGNHAKDFQFIIDKVRNRMEGWRAKLLSETTRTVLIKNVISAIPIYSMSIFLLPKSTTEALVRHFWWTGSSEGGIFLSLLSWDNICRPSCSGGLGIHKFNDINFCLIAKLGWQLAKNRSSLWCQVILGKYGHLGGFWGRNLPRNASRVARGIWKTKEFIKDNSIWVIGGNSRVKLWQGSWSCADGVCINPCDLNPGVVTDITVGNLMSDGESSWDISLLERFFRPEAYKKILSCNISDLPDRDSLMWKSSSFGEFMLKNAYWDLHSRDFFIDKNCRILWKLPIHERHKLFLWKCAKDCLPFSSRLGIIFGNITGKCVLCNADSSDFDAHFLSLCPITQGLWLASKRKLKIDSIPLHSGAEVVNWLSRYASLCSGGIMKDKNEFFIFAAVLYHNLWFFRNDTYHNHTQWTHTEMMNRVTQEFSYHWKCYMDTKFCNEGGSIPIMTRWALPRLGRIRVNVDFATNKGIGAVGVVVREAGGNILLLFAIKTWFLTITHGELWAVLRGLEVISYFGYTMADLFSDCQIVVNALLKATSPHWNVQVVFSKTLTLMSSLSVSPVWVPRTANQAVHVLACWGTNNDCKGFLNF